MKLLLFLLLSSGAFAQVLAPVDAAAELAKVGVLELINMQRASLGVAPVERDLDIEAVTQEYTETMASGARPFGHDGLSERCRLIRIALAGGNLCGEILAWGHHSPSAVHTGWMNSPGHNRAMIEPRYTRAGFAYSVNSNGRQYWSVLFLER